MMACPICGKLYNNEYVVNLHIHTDHARVSFLNETRCLCGRDVRHWYEDSQEERRAHLIAEATRARLRIPRTN